MTSPRQRIAQIDKQITAVRRTLRSRETVDTMSAESWQAAWDKHPDLHAQSNDLWRQRGIAQQERDEADHKEHLRQLRSDRAKARARRCAKCGERLAA